MLNFGDMIFQLFGLAVMLLPLVLIVLIIYFGVKYIRRAEKRADERLNLDKESSLLQEQQLKLIESLNERLTRIEKTLNEID
ncbi:hypothetical protein [Robertmurraya andreesenii]|uniref:Membrane protein n=1 Tax=Anoxybacillus andreesenii TaxID=1325932 RepID=A0ABT9V499_9BACL|nr:hypothetical protein [Robertmurraya andreesenii]MDQ0155759.1 putative membrane protein [Robertmurraya andreesenii]